MDIHLQSNPQLHFRVNGGANSRSSAEDEALQFLSQEEQECIQFFEETIDSLEESLNQEERSGPEPVQLHALETSSSTSGSIPGSSSASSPGPSVVPPMADRRGPKDQDIIDLLQPDLVQTKEPVFDPTMDLVQTKELVFDPTMPDFQNMVRTPDSHVEVRSSKRDLMDTLPSEYNPPLPSSSYGPGGDHLPYHPPGSIPTPVLIAQKIAQNQGGGGPTNVLLPSAVLRRRSLDSDKPALSYADHADHASSSKQGPPTSTKPSRFPANISVTLGGKLESHNNNSQSLASVSMHERRAQMLANLTGTCHPLEEQHATAASSAPPPSAPPPEKDRNLPTRSVSFRDPTPDKSRMEALSKLGLTRNRARSGGSSPPVTPPTPTSDTTDTGTSANPPIPAVPATPPSQTLVAETRAETAVLPDPISPKTIKANPSPPSTVSQSTYKTVTQSTDWPPPPPPESEPTVTPTPPEVASLDFNTYGGKSMVVNPSASNNSMVVNPSASNNSMVVNPSASNNSMVVNPSASNNSMVVNPSASNNRSEPSVTEGDHDGKAHPSLVVATTSDYNSYGGKSKVMTTAPAPITRSDLPDILSSHIDKSRAPPSPTAAPGRPEMLPYEVNSYGGKTRSITPSSRGSNPSSRGPARTPSKAPQAPSPAPKPIRQLPHHHHGPSLSTPQRAAAGGQRPPSPEPMRRRSISKPAAFRSQGITVQFSGRGATDESRRDALRKLGLLKDTC